MKALLNEPDLSMISLTDPSGAIIINSNPAKPISATGKRIIEQAKLKKDIVFSDMFKYDDETVYIDLAIPLYLNPESREGLSGVYQVRHGLWLQK